MALLMSLVLGTGFALSGNSVSAQSYQMNDKQSYDDSSYSSDSYSKYPTDDKPYVCQKGPFKGFYVSSVEFCKAGFDDRKDRHNGDDKERSNFDFYVVTGEASSESFGGAATLTSTAACEEGDQVTGGGFELTSTPPPSPLTGTGDADVTVSKPVENLGGASGEGWTSIAQVEAENVLEYSLIAYAVCFDTPEKNNNHDYPEEDYSNRM